MQKIQEYQDFIDRIMFLGILVDSENPGHPGLEWHDHASFVSGWMQKIMDTRIWKTRLCICVRVGGCRKSRSTRTWKMRSCCCALPCHSACSVWTASTSTTSWLCELRDWRSGLLPLRWTKIGTSTDREYAGVWVWFERVLCISHWMDWYIGFSLAPSWASSSGCQCRSFCRVRMSDALSRLCLFVTVVAVTNGEGVGRGDKKLIWMQCWNLYLVRSHLTVTVCKRSSVPHKLEDFTIW